MKRVRPFVLPARQPTDAHSATAGRKIGSSTGRIGLSDIVFVSGDSVRVCRVETAGDTLLDVPLPLSLCHDTVGDAAGLVEGVQVTQVGGVLLLRVE